MSSESTINRFRSEAYEPRIRDMDPLVTEEGEAPNRAETSSFKSEESICNAEVLDTPEPRGGSMPCDQELQIKRSSLISREAHFDMSPEVIQLTKRNRKLRASLQRYGQVCVVPQDGTASSVHPVQPFLILESESLRPPIRSHPEYL